MTAGTSMYQNENLNLSSITVITSRNDQLTLITVEGDSKNHDAI